MSKRHTIYVNVTVERLLAITCSVTTTYPVLFVKALCYQKKQSKASWTQISRVSFK